jgi:chorismate mutase
MAVRAVRGATHLDADDADEMRDAVVELLTEMLSRNSLTTDDLISVLLTSTPDLVSTFPASAVRAMRLADVPLISAQEIGVTGAMPRVVRVMAHVETPLARADITHVYQRGAQALRMDLAQ